MFDWLLAATRLGKRTQLRGVLECGRDPLVLNGTFRGVIRSKSSVTIGRRGRVVGDINARDVIVAGHVEGTVVAKRNLHMRSTGVVDGDAFYNTLRVDKGGVVKGRTTTLTANGELPPASDHAREALRAGALQLPEAKGAKSERTRGGKKPLSVPPRAPDSVTSGITSAWGALDAATSERVLAAQPESGNGDETPRSRADVKAKDDGQGAKAKKPARKTKNRPKTLPSSKTAAKLKERPQTDRRTNPMGAMTPPPPTPRSGGRTVSDKPPSKPSSRPPSRSGVTKATRDPSKTEGNNSGSIAALSDELTDGTTSSVARKGKASADKTTKSKGSAAKPSAKAAAKKKAAGG